MSVVKINSLAEFQNNVGSIVTFDASVLSILAEGNKDQKKPINVTLKLEATGENFVIASWNWQILDLLKKMTRTVEFAEFEGTVTTYKDQIQIRVGKILTVYTSDSKQKKLTVVENVEARVNEFIEENIKEPFCKMILDRLIIKNSNFFIWPAARTIHHNFKGGLALHSLGVARVALSYSNIYKNDALDKDILLTGALLHDIGKMREYQDNCEISFEGNFMSHLVSGVLMVEQAVMGQPLNDYQKRIVTTLEHIIQSHHEKLEYGSPITPKCLEAVMVSMADLADSKFEAVMSALNNTNEESFTEPQKVVEGGKVYRWKKQH